MNKEPSVHIYPIADDHLESLVEIAIQTFNETFADTNSEEDMQVYNTRHFTREKLLEELEDPCSWFYFAEYGGTLAGYLKVNTDEAQTELREKEGFEVERIYVLKAYHGKGVGPALMDFAIKKGKELNKTYLWLGVWEHNQRALRFYTRYGLKVFDDHVFMMGKTPQRDVLMRMVLK